MNDHGIPDPMGPAEWLLVTLVAAVLAAALLSRPLRCGDADGGRDREARRSQKNEQHQ